MGASASLLGLRAVYEGFDTRVTGLVMSAYYLGFLFGAIRAPKIIRRVGHVRTFAALAALASVTILVHALVIDPWVWGGMRLATGFAACGIYIVVESWLNQVADNRNRGQLLALYMITYHLGMAGGQFVLKMADPGSFELFSLISVLISLAAIPILITAIQMPVFRAPATVSIRTLFRWAPSGVIGAFMVNICYAIIFGMGAVYADQRGFNTADVALFMATLITGGLILQWPMGKISDRFDRRAVIAFASCAAVYCALSIAWHDGPLDNYLLAMTFMFGGFCLPLYALYQSLTNDDLDADKAVGVSSTLLLVGGMGAIIGPVFVSLVMKNWGHESYFMTLALLCSGMAIYAVYRRLFHPYRTDFQRKAFQVHAPSAVGTLLKQDA
jgi:MFS family permease